MVSIYEDELKLGVFVALIWWAWFEAKDTNRVQEIREKIVASLIGGICCLAVVRLMVTYLPMRIRPLANPDLGLGFPIPGEGFKDWSSFPSDHAALFFFLTVCLFSISVPLGSLALFDTVFLICFPRVFVGVHYPTDILAGAAMGIADGLLFTRERIRKYLAGPILRWMDFHPASFYASAFLLSFVLAHVFFPVLRIVWEVKGLAAIVAHAHPIAR
jgi:PAP2 superfamily protein